ncbi:hypothetical protein FRC02_002096 [Tulasnella sp. 418]|nr:hypothetical protein FRC02_002096 [Tulasnella sp. 418]
MFSYSPLFAQGLSMIECNAPAHKRKRPSSSSSYLKDVSNNIKGRSFLKLSLKTDSSVSKETPRSASVGEFSFRPSSPRRRSLPLAKPAPSSSLPAIPINTTPVPERPSSPAPSSTVFVTSSQRKQRKHATVAPGLTLPLQDAQSLRTLSTTVDTLYRKDKRSDALAALEGRRRHPIPASALGASFVPSMILQEEDDDEEDDLFVEPSILEESRPVLRSHLSFTSTLYPTSSSNPSYTISFANPNNKSSSFIILPPPTTRSARAKSPSSPSFPISSPPTIASSLSVSNNPSRRASTGTNNIGWGMTFIDLTDDSNNSVRWIKPSVLV